jgi:hypothetical protein
MLPGIKTGLALTSALATFAACADVTIESRFDVEAAGGLGMFASSGTSTTRISGNKSRSDTQSQSKSKLVKTFTGGNNESVDITRIDLGLLWNLEPEKSRYTETSFEQMRQMLEQGMQQMQASNAGGNPLPVSEESCTWDEGKTEVSKPGDKEKIAGIKTERVIVQHTRTCTDAKSGATCSMTWTLDQQLAKKAPGSQEMEDFWRAYADNMGLEELVQQRNQPGMMAMASLFRGGMDETLSEAAEFRGYPMKTTMEMMIGGENCTMADGQQIAASDIFADATTDAQNAAVDQAAAEAGSAIGQGAAEVAGNGVGGRIAGSAVGAFGSKIAGGLFGGMKKKKEAPPPEARDAGAAAGEVRLFRVTSETTRLSEDSVDPGIFEVPAGWKKIVREDWAPQAQ